MKHVIWSLGMVCIVLCGTQTTFSQSTPPESVKPSFRPSQRPDGVVETNYPPASVNAWQQLDEKNVLFKKRVWREIDVKQKKNMFFLYPGDEQTGGGMYIEILLAAIRTGKVQAFGDDRFAIPLTPEQIERKIAGAPQTITIIHPDDGTEVDSVIYPGFNPNTVVKFRIKEDWIFDAKEGRMKVRIIGLAPYQDRYTSDGEYLGTTPLFWLYYPELRTVHAQYTVYNPLNDVHRETWDDFFEQRNFASHIVKSTLNNPMQEPIAATRKGVDALQASEEIAEALFQKEHDLWMK